MISGYSLLEYLHLALETLFRPVEERGFWDGEKIIRALRYKIMKTDKFIWTPDNSIGWRYTPFALMSVMYWRASEISTDIYDLKIKAELNYFIRNIKNQRILLQIPSYGIGPLILSFSLAKKIFQDENYKDIAWYLYNYSKKSFDFSNSEDSLLLYGWSFLDEIEQNNDLRDNINRVLEKIIKKQNKKGLFIFKNSGTERHQNQMYILWALGKAIEVLNKKKYLKNIEKTLNYTIKYRMLENGAFIWNNPSLITKLRKEILGKIVGVFPHWKLLFECHQTFFINVVLQYYRAGGEEAYKEYIFQAVDWIYGKNALGENLVELSKIGVPMRVMTINGDINVKWQKFKGAYEIGSYIMALTGLIKQLNKDYG